MPHYLHNTTAEDVAREHRTEALKEIKELKAWLTTMEEEIERVTKGAFSISWASEMMNRALNVYNELARSNGAILVRGKKESEDD